MEESIKIDWVGGISKRDPGERVGAVRKFARRNDTKTRYMVLVVTWRKGRRREEIRKKCLVLLTYEKFVHISDVPITNYSNHE